MSTTLSPNTQAILLLTAPLKAGSVASSDALAPGEYKRLAAYLRETRRQPADLLGAAAPEVLAGCCPPLDLERLRRLLARGLALSRAVEYWNARAIWVLSRADETYPKRLKAVLREDAPAILYGCGDAGLLDAGGLAVVGSRAVDEALIAYARSVGGLAMRAGRVLMSGGAKGIDQAAMRGALVAGGRSIGILADSLQRAAMSPTYRDALREGRLALISPYDPQAGFQVGHAMRRNRLVYALADAALVVDSDLDRGGTWAGATEALNGAHRVYVRSTGSGSDGLEALRRRGARSWPNPQDPLAFARIMAEPSRAQHALPL